MAVQVVVGLLGFYLHVRPTSAARRVALGTFLYGAPLFAPLLFADLASSPPWASGASPGPRSSCSTGHGVGEASP